MYRCRCALVWERDKGAVYNLVTKYFERLRREERGNEAAEGALTSLKQWLKGHPRALEY